MKISLFAAVLSTALIASTAQAQNYRGQGSGYDYARVISAQPIYDSVQVDAGREVCRNERVEYVENYRPRSESSSVVGAIIGGVIGNQFGSGRGRAAATVAGAALGSAVARDSQRHDRRHSRTRYGNERVCGYEPSYRTERELVGYNVRYDYKGQIGETVTRNRPGNSIRVQVAVTAIED